MTKRAGGRFRSLVVVLTVAALIGTGCGEPASAPTVDALAARGGLSGPVVNSFVPSDAPQHITIDLTVNGSGFDKGSWVRLEKNKVPADGITTNSTTFISSSQLVANVTITDQALADYYDVAVITSGGKRGVGAEQFEVLEVLWMGPLDGLRLYQTTEINEQGNVAGWGGNASAFFWSGGQATWLQGDLIGFPSGINDLDQVVGNTCGWSQAVNPSCDWSQQYGVVWQRTNGTWTTLAVTAIGTLVVDITNKGELFGYRSSPGPVPWKKETILGAEVPLPLPAGRDTAHVLSANNTGQAVGDDLLWSFEVDGALKILQLPAPSGGTRPTAVDLGDESGGQLFAVGNAFFKGRRQPARWHLARVNGSWQVVAAERLGAPFTTRVYNEGAARGVNTAGDAVGYFYDAGGVARPIKWLQSGTPLLLPYPRGSANAMAFAVNNAGWITGYYEAPYQGAVVWRVP